MAAPTEEVSRTLKDALFETLSSILSPVHEVRLSAEEQISVLEVTDGNFQLFSYSRCIYFSPVKYTVQRREINIFIRETLSVPFIGMYFKYRKTTTM